MHSISKDLVNFLTITEEDAAQRLDNFLIKVLKGVPKSHIHRIIRAGEVRINKKRSDATYRLQINDIVRVPPVKIAAKALNPQNAPAPARDFPIVYEDDVLLVINKPAGVAVHGGSGISFGVIEQLRQARPEARYLELVHRLDKETSGLLMIAKKRSALVKLHEIIRQNIPQKKYFALGLGQWPANVSHVKLPLLKYQGANGEKMVRVNDDGQYAHTLFTVQQQYHQFVLVEANLKTGRTHQIRVHMQANGCPIAGDERYGDYERNKQLTKQGLKRMFLHAHELSLPHPVSGEPLVINAPLPKELTHFLKNLSHD
ncbi:MAG: 23S rRNA pseudouridine(955/2504/2580) synthase RluC [Neisseriaceae bacterium]|nr:23S rRNA pseudouridine(955/2504/2580) synthase RluC [Neisseriaceae bacterium]MBP6862928.1 23S rRNA pseudouridine(955/2504/2580) synthase RluC [Neisseriaceae bacterium]